jgi:hypothetical protein
MRWTEDCLTLDSTGVRTCNYASWARSHELPPPQARPEPMYVPFTPYAEVNCEERASSRIYRRRMYHRCDAPPMYLQCRHAFDCEAKNGIDDPQMG